MNDKLSKIGEELFEKIITSLPLTDNAKKSMRNFQKLRKELSKESDRGMALYATAYLDNQLELMLREKLIGSNKHFKDIFSFNGAVGTFSSKIKLSYSIGLLDKISMDDINVLRKIRNEFAHSDQNISFESEHIKELCENLKLNVRPDDASPRSIFINVVAGISGKIEGTLNVAKKFEELFEQDLEERKENFKKAMDTLFDTLE